MSEEGLNKGQGQDQETKTPFFDSSEISKKESVEHFTNVAGAKERAKAAERAKKAAEAEAREVHEADVRAASEQMKKAENGKKKGVAHFLFSGWHKIVTIIIALALIVGGVILGIKLFGSESYEVKTEKDIAARDMAIKIEDDVRTLVESDPSVEKYSEGKKIYEDAIKKANKHEVVFLRIEYAEFVYRNSKDFAEATDILGDIQNSIDTEVAADFYNYRVRMMYYEAGSGEEFQEVSVRGE